MRILDIPPSGTLGTTVSVRTRYGQTCRPYVSPKNRRTPAPVRIRSNFVRVLARWGALTDEQRTVWAMAAEGVESRPRLGQSGGLSGYLLFVKINSTLAYYGQPPVVAPPERPIFDPNPVDGLVITNTGGIIELKLRVTSVPGAQMVVLGITRAGRGFRSPSILLFSVSCRLRRTATVRSPSFLLPATGYSAPAGASSFAPGSTSTAGRISRNKPPPSSRRLSLPEGLLLKRLRDTPDEIRMTIE